MDNEYKESHLFELFNTVEEENKPPYSLIFIISVVALMGLSAINPAFGGLLFIAAIFGIVKLFEGFGELEAAKYTLTSENNLTTILRKQKEKQEKIIEEKKLETPHFKLVLQGIKDDIEIIQSAANGADTDLSDNLNAIIIIAKKIEDEINLDNSNFAQVERVFTYYIPEIVKLLKARGIAMRAKNNDKILEIDGMFIRLKAVIQNYANRIYEEDIREIDIDLKLLEQSLAQDLPLEMRIKDKI